MRGCIHVYRMHSIKHDQGAAVKENVHELRDAHTYTHGVLRPRRRSTLSNTIRKRSTLKSKRVKKQQNTNSSISHQYSLYRFPYLPALCHRQSSYLSINLPLYLYVSYLSYVATYLPFFLFFYLPLYLPFYLPSYLPFYLPSYLLSYLYIYLPI